MIPPPFFVTNITVVADLDSISQYNVFVIGLGKTGS